MEFYVELILNIVFISLFIGLFYFNYVVKVEKQLIESQATFIAKSVSNDLLILPDPILQSLNNSLTLSNSTNLSHKQIDNNLSLEQNTYTTLFYIYIIGIVLAFTICEMNNLYLLSYLIKAFIVLVFIGLTEYGFLTLVIKNFISADPNYIKYNFLQNLKTQLNS